ncbi:putative Ig domain-containing protein [Streptomyces sp. NPDC012765]|uniref:calcium-binding protein n=1 Tax=Streptomyces sp. NPDC012765 TaxID=3155249 RepID=UPI0033E1BDE7
MTLTVQHRTSGRGGTGAGARGRRALARQAAVLLVAMAVPAAGLVVSAAAPAAAATITRTFDAGADQPFTVAAGVTRLQVTAKGADGVQATQGSAAGTGARVAGILTVTPGSTLYVNVGTGGGPAGVGQFPARNGGAGGGSSDVRTCDSNASGCVLTGVPATDPRLIVAGGGGGSAPGSVMTVSTGQGGDAGDSGRPGTSMTDGSASGGGGTPIAAGAAGTTLCAPVQPGDLPGGPGALGAGGAGGASINFGGGGGGGGWFGGGGGAGCYQIATNRFGAGSGGGGSNRVPTGGTSTAVSGAAEVTIAYEVADLAFVTTDPLPDGTQGAPYSTTLQTSGGTGAPTFAVTVGSLPPGLALNTTTGQITGTPTAAGTYAFTVTATDPDPQVPPALRQFTLTVQPPAAVTCANATPTLQGNAGNNLLIGTPGDDRIFGLGGNDIIDGRGGNDLICGGDGNDALTGSAGNDRIEGQNGNDAVNGGDGNDAQFGGAGNDVQDGGAGTNTNDGGAGVNVCTRPRTGPGCTV